MAFVCLGCVQNILLYYIMTIALSHGIHFEHKRTQRTRYPQQTEPPRYYYYQVSLCEGETYTLTCEENEQFWDQIYLFGRVTYDKERKTAWGAEYKRCSKEYSYNDRECSQVMRELGLYGNTYKSWNYAKYGELLCPRKATSCTVTASESWTHIKPNCQVNPNHDLELVVQYVCAPVGCYASPCGDGGSCSDCTDRGDCASKYLPEADFICTCHAGFTGRTCVDVNECSSNPCLNAGACNNLVNHFTCSCSAGWTGTLCEINTNECQSLPCKNGGTCNDLYNLFTCTCPGGYNGTQCEVDIDECDSTPCKNNGICHNLVNNVTCDCVRGFYGVNCEIENDECHSHPCQNHGTCEDRINEYICNCIVGYTGIHCETNINECESAPCKNNGTCTDLLNGYICSCIIGNFIGTVCELDLRACQSNPCKHGTCIILSPSGYECQCDNGLVQSECENEAQDHCDPNPCLNGAACANINSSYSCICQAGFLGDTCDQDIDDCAEEPCDDNEDCIDKVNDYECLTSAKSNENIPNTEICRPNPCNNGGSCQTIYDNNASSTYTCFCSEGFTGRDCGEAINNCNNKHCLNGGTCISTINGFECFCTTNYNGMMCDHRIESCSDTPCQNQGTCTDTNGVTCHCHDGFTGSRCEAFVYGETDFQHAFTRQYCSWNTKHNNRKIKTYVLSNIKFYNILTMTYCLNKCACDPACLSVSYNPSSQRCFLNYGTRLSVGSRYTTKIGWKYRDYNCTGDGRFFQHTSIGSMCKWNDVRVKLRMKTKSQISSHDKKTLTACRQMCEETSGCKSIAFKPKIDKCRLYKHSQTSHPNNSKVASYWIYYDFSCPDGVTLKRAALHEDNNISTSRDIDEAQNSQLYQNSSANLFWCIYSGKAMRHTMQSGQKYCVTLYSVPVIFSQTKPKCSLFNPNDAPYKFVTQELVHITMKQANVMHIWVTSSNYYNNGSAENNSLNLEWRHHALHHGCLVYSPFQERKVLRVPCDNQFPYICL